MKARDKTLRRIAQEAARLMNEEGIEDHHRAKLKAIERLALPDTHRTLPKDEDVDAARLDYWRLFGRDKAAPKHIDTLRILALEIMDRLEPFSPRLVGSVADGTAGQHSPIIIHVFPDTPEDVITTLIDLRIPFREGQHLSRLGKERLGQLPALSLNHPRSTIDILFFPPSLQGRSTPRKKDGPVQASCSDLRRMLERDKDAPVAV